MSSFLERARALYEKGDLARAAFVLAEGVKRAPSSEEGLNWFLQIYLEEMEQPGVEQELVRVLETQSDGEQLLDAISAELKSRQQYDRLNYLNRVRALRTPPISSNGPDHRESKPSRNSHPGNSTGSISAPAQTGSNLVGQSDDLDELTELMRGPRSRRRRRRRSRANPAEQRRPATADGSLDAAAIAERSGLSPEQIAQINQDLRGSSSSQPALQVFTDEPLPVDPRLTAGIRRRRRRRRPKNTLAATSQGVLALDSGHDAGRDSWRGFEGVAAGEDPRDLSEVLRTGATTAITGQTPVDESEKLKGSTSVRARNETSRKRRRTARTVAARASAALAARENSDAPVTKGVPTPVPAAPASAGSVVTSTRQPKTGAEEVAECPKLPAPESEAKALVAKSASNTPNRAAAKSPASSINSARASEEHPMRKIGFDGLGLGPLNLESVIKEPNRRPELIPVGTRPETAVGKRDEIQKQDNSQEQDNQKQDNNQLMAVSDEGWSFGEGMQTPTQSEAPQEPRRRIRRGSRGVAKAAPAAATAMAKGLKWTTGGKRGPLVLLTVALLGVGSVSYRACTEFVATQLAEADAYTAQADGDALLQALSLYDEHLGDSNDVRGERRDFVRGLLAADYNEEVPSLAYSAEEARTVYGVAAVLLAHLADDNLTLARPESDDLVARFEDDWLAHWAQGRVASQESDWERAQAAFLRARALDERAVLPVLGLVDIAVRAGEDAEAEALLADLEALNPDHSVLRVATVAIAFGVDPIRSSVGTLDADLPDPTATLLASRTREWITYLEARGDLANWHIERVGRGLRTLRSEQSGELGVRVNLLEAVLAARHYELDDVHDAFSRAEHAVPAGSPSSAVIRRLSGQILADMGRPEMALALVPSEPSSPTGAANEIDRARLMIDAGMEVEALRVLSRTMEQPATEIASLRILVDFHLRRGAGDRAEMRAEGLTEERDTAYATARLATDEWRWESVQAQAERALRGNSTDLDSLWLWARATAHLGMAERALERIDEWAERSLLVGQFDRARLDVLLISGRAPRETLAEFVSVLQSTEPTSMLTLGVLARAYEAIGDEQRARSFAERVLAGEPNNRNMHALLGRLLHHSGLTEDGNSHLASYLALAPQTEPTDWARELMTDPVAN